MNKHDFLKATGQVSIVKTKADGTVEKTEIPNLVVQVGLNYIAARMLETGRPSEMSHMAIGTNSTTPAAGDTTLGAQASAGRQPLTSKSASGNTVTYVATFDPGEGTGVLREAGIFNSSTAGTMLCRTVFPTVTKEAGDTITITWAVTVS